MPSSPFSSLSLVALLTMLCSTSQATHHGPPWSSLPHGLDGPCIFWQILISGSQGGPGPVAGWWWFLVCSSLVCGWLTLTLEPQLATLVMAYLVDG